MVILCALIPASKGGITSNVPNLAEIILNDSVLQFAAMQELTRQKFRAQRR